MNSHAQEMFYDQIGSRSPGSHRQQQQQTLNRHTSRQPMDAYGNMSNSSFLQDEQTPRFEPSNSRYDRMNSSILPQEFYNMGGAQSWNPQAFASNGIGGANASFGFGTIGGRMRPPATARRTNLPDTWMNDQPQMNPPAGFGGLGMNGSQQIRSHNYMPDPDDDLIPTAIVIKNIPFAVKKEQLVEVMNDLNLPLPYAFNYHFDNGVFRGLAFANFTSPEETAQVIAALNHYELQGRKLRVEYKKMLPLQERERIEREKRERRGQLEEQHRPMGQHTLHSQHSMSSLSSHMNAAASPSPMSSGAGGPPIKPDLNDPRTLTFYNEIFSFKEDLSRETLIFSASLTSTERRIVHTLAHNLNLQHASRGNGEQRQVHVTRNPPGSNISPPIPQLSSFHSDPSRRVLNRAATTDFSESRANDAALYGTLRAQQSGGYLGIPDSPGVFGNRNELRAAKSFADLRSYTPSPTPSSASFPVALQSNAQNVREMAAMGNLPNTSVQGSSAAALAHDDHGFLNGFGNLTIGTNIAPGPNRGSPRSLRSMFSWDSQQVPSHQVPSHQVPSAGPIGSNRGFATMNNHNDGSRERNTAMPIRQPSIPSDRGASAFSRNRQNGHQQRSSDETRHSQPDIILE